MASLVLHGEATYYAQQGNESNTCSIVRVVDSPPDFSCILTWLVEYAKRKLVNSFSMVPFVPYILVVVLLQSTAALATLPTVSKAYFPQSVPLIELEYVVQKPGTVRFRNYRKIRQRLKENPDEYLRRNDESEESDLVWNDLSEVLRGFPTIRSWGGGGGHGFQLHIPIPFWGGVVFDSGKQIRTLHASASPETLEEWKALRESDIRKKLMDELEDKFQECQEKYSSKTVRLNWTKSPGPPVGICELVYAIKEIGTPPSDGALEIDPEQEARAARLERRRKLEMMKFTARSLLAKMRGKELQLQCKLVAVPKDGNDGKPRQLKPSAILSETARDALDNAKPWINAYSGSCRVKVSKDTVHIFSYYGCKNGVSSIRARKIIQRALEKKAKQYPDWFEVSFPFGNQTFSFLTMEPSSPSSEFN